MYCIGELAKMAEVTFDTICYYEKQQMMEHEVRIEGGFCLYIESDFQRLKFICHARQLGFSLELICELLLICIDFEHYICQELKGIVQERLQEVEARIAELQSMQRFLQCFNDACCGTAYSSVYCLIFEAFEQGASGVKSGC